MISKSTLRITLTAMDHLPLVDLALHALELLETERLDCTHLSNRLDEELELRIKREDELTDLLKENPNA